MPELSCIKCEVELDFILNEEDCFCTSPQSLILSPDAYSWEAQRDIPCNQDD